MKYILEPEVSGGFGKNVKLDNTIHPPVVKHLHFEFQGWLGDDIIETFPCYLVSGKLRAALEESDLSGFRFRECEISFSENVHHLKIPEFYWLEVIGAIDSKDDFSSHKDFRLKISEKAYALLKMFKIKNCLVEKF